MSDIQKNDSYFNFRLAAKRFLKKLPTEKIIKEALKNKEEAVQNNGGEKAKINLPEVLENKDVKSLMDVNTQILLNMRNIQIKHSEQVAEMLDFTQETAIKSSQEKSNSTQETAVEDNPQRSNSIQATDNNSQQDTQASVNMSEAWTKEELIDTLKKSGDSQGHQMLWSALANNDQTVYGMAILATFFDEQDGKYSIKEDLSVAGKKINTLDDIAELYTYYQKLYNAQYNATPPEGMNIKLDPKTHMPIVKVTKDDLANCGYNFLPEEIDAYFNKNSDGTYSLKQGAVKLRVGKEVAFLTFDDFVKYLKGEDTICMGLTYFNPDPAQGYEGGLKLASNFPFVTQNIDDRSAEEMHQYAAENRHGIEGAVHQNFIRSYQAELNSKFPNSGIDLSKYFYQSEHGEYFPNTQAIERDFPQYGVAGFLNMQPLADVVNGEADLTEVFQVNESKPANEEQKTEYVVRSLESAQQKLEEEIANNPDKYVPTFLPNVFWVVDENDPSGGYYKEFSFETSSGSRTWLTGVSVGGGVSTWGDQTYLHPEEDGASIPAKYAAAWLGGYDLVAVKADNSTYKNDNIFYKDGKYYKYEGIENITVYTYNAMDGIEMRQSYAERIQERILSGMVELSEEELKDLNLK